MTADLQRHYGTDYRDRWRFDADGHRKLTLRMLAAFVWNMPTDSAFRTALNGGEREWEISDYLLAQNVQVSAGSDKPHPAMPQPKAKAEQTPERKKALAKAKRAVKQRRKAIEAGLIT